MKPKLRIVGKIDKTHLMELQLQQHLDTTTFLLEYEVYSGPARRKLYTNKGQILVCNGEREIVLIVQPEEDSKAA